MFCCSLGLFYCCIIVCVALLWVLFDLFSCFLLACFAEVFCLLIGVLLVILHCVIVFAFDLSWVVEFMSFAWDDWCFYCLLTWLVCWLITMYLRYAVVVWILLFAEFCYFGLIWFWCYCWEIVCLIVLLVYSCACLLWLLGFGFFVVMVSRVVILFYFGMLILFCLFVAWLFVFVYLVVYLLCLLFWWLFWLFGWC